MSCIFLSVSWSSSLFVFLHGQETEPEQEEPEQETEPEQSLFWSAASRASDERLSLPLKRMVECKDR